MGMGDILIGMNGYGKDINGNGWVWEGLEWKWLGMGGTWMGMDGYGRDMNKNGWVREGY